MQDGEGAAEGGGTVHLGVADDRSIAGGPARLLLLHSEGEATAPKAGLHLHMRTFRHPWQCRFGRKGGYIDASSYVEIHDK